MYWAIICYSNIQVYQCPQPAKYAKTVYDPPAPIGIHITTEPQTTSDMPSTVQPRGSNAAAIAVPIILVIIGITVVLIIIILVMVIWRQQRQLKEKSPNQIAIGMPWIMVFWSDKLRLYTPSQMTVSMVYTVYCCFLQNDLVILKQQLHAVE